MVSFRIREAEALREEATNEPILSGALPGGEREREREREREKKERMMGLEPTTFCMASRRSSQLSYIRVGPQYSPA
jgi:hypothetical protein